MSEQKQAKIADAQPLCSLPCPKCGNTDVYRRFYRKDENTNEGSGPSRNTLSTEWVDRGSVFVQNARKDCIVHTCRCCGYMWDSDPMDHVPTHDELSGKYRDILGDKQT